MFLKTLAVEENLVMVNAGITLAIIQFSFIILSQGVTVKMPQEYQE